MKSLSTLIFLIFIYGCEKKPPIVGDFGGIHFSLLDQNNKQIIFPDFVKNKIVVMNYIFTNCPDICPLSTNNMRLIQERFKKEKINNVQFISLSFDPEFDSPEVLRKFTAIRNLDLSNWAFLTGKKSVTDEVIQKVGVLAVPGDSTVFKDGRKIYYYIHTDRIQLIDQESRIRKNYKGSTIDVDEIVADVKLLR